MKHTLRIIIWVIAVTLGVCASAQTDTKRAFRIYMHDGSVQFFFYSDIQSMTVGYEDGDMERPVQIINTPDSVYTFAMADIDSVSFARPVTEYKSNVVRLEDGLRSYLTASDSLKLTFRSDVPRNLFPTEGGYLVTLKCDELLPCGFIGKLASVHEEGGGVVALCDKAAATDVFEKVFIAIGEKNTESNNNTNIQRTPEYYNVWNGDIDVPPVGFKVNLDIGLGTGMFSGGYSQGGGFEISTQKFHTNTFFMVENGNVDFSMQCQGEHTLNLDASAGFSASFSKDFPVVKVPIRLPYVFIPVGSCDFGIYFNAEAGIGFNHHFKVPFSSITNYSFGTRWYSAIGLVPDINGVSNCHITMGVPEKELDIEGSASAELGVYGSANFYPAVEEIFKLSSGLRAGLKISSQKSWLPPVSPIYGVNTEMYDELNRDDFFRLDWLNAGFVSFESKLYDVYLNEKIQWNATRNNPIWTCGVVPEFFDVSLNEVDAPGSLKATATLRRKLAFNANVGLGLYDSSDKLVDSWWCDVKYIDQENTNITHDFSNLKVGEKYTLHPLVHTLNKNMVANPSASNQMEPSIYTQVAENITHSSATLTALITKIPEDRNFKAGFVYYDTPDNKKIVMVDNSTTNVIADISGLKDNTNYYFYAFVQFGDYIENGEIKDFKTLEIEADDYFVVQCEGEGKLDFDFNTGIEVLNILCDDNTQAEFSMRNSKINWSLFTKSGFHHYKVFYKGEFENIYFYNYGNTLCGGNIQTPISINKNFVNQRTKISEISASETGDYILTVPHLKLLFCKTDFATSIASINLSGCEELTEVEAHSFLGAPVLKKLDLSNCTNLSYIGGFSECPSLTTVNVSNCPNLTYMHNYSFRNSPLLTTVDFSHCPNLPNIGKYAFSNCPELRSADFNGCTSLTDIQEHAFDDCPPLTSVDISGCENIKTIENCFNRCSSLISIDISKCKKLTTFGGFDNCSSLTSIDLSNFNNLTTFGGFHNCSSLISLDLSNCNNLTTFGGFSRCTSLSFVNFEGCTNLTDIGYESFYYCPSLTSIDLKGLTSLKYIGQYAFEFCENLKKVTLPKNVYLDTWAFFDCPAVETVYCYPPEPPTYNLNPFPHKPDNFAKIYVPASSLGIYQQKWGIWAGDRCLNIFPM